jgi:hypothetical protein
LREASVAAILSLVQWGGNVSIPWLHPLNLTSFMLKQLFLLLIKEGHWTEEIVTLQYV